MKLAFIVNMPGETRAYETVFEGKENIHLVTGADISEDLKPAKELIAQLVQEGYTYFDCCGDFDEEIVKELETAAEGIEVYGAKYYDEEWPKFEKLTEEEEASYGIIVCLDDVEKLTTKEIPHPGFKVTVKYVNGLDMALKAAKEMVSEGVGDMELCGWFDKEKYGKVIEAIGGVKPVGTCGEI